MMRLQIHCSNPTRFSFLKQQQAGKCIHMLDFAANDQFGIKMAQSAQRANGIKGQRRNLVSIWGVHAGGQPSRIYRGGCWPTKAACMQLQEQSEGQVPLSIGGNSGLNQNLEAG